jgi:hypothetical protein
VGRREQDKWNVWDKRVRDLGIYIVALAGVVNQLFFSKNPSETILVFLAAMLGFPLILKADEVRRIGREQAPYETDEERRQHDDKRTNTKKVR